MLLKLPSHQLSQVPWLMIPSDNINETHCRFFSILENKMYSLEIPELRWRYYFPWGKILRFIFWWRNLGLVTILPCQRWHGLHHLFQGISPYDSAWWEWYLVNFLWLERFTNGINLFTPCCLHSTKGLPLGLQIRSKRLEMEGGKEHRR